MTAWELTGTVFKISAVLALFFIVVRREKRSVKSIGWQPPGLKDVVLGVAAFLAVRGLSRVIWPLALTVMPKAVADLRAGAASYANLPLSLNVLGAISNGAAEEVGYRGYALERLSEVTGSTWLGAGIPYVVEVLCHAPIWGLHGMLLKAPPLLIFVLLYLWQRSLPACILGHVLCDVVSIFR